MLRELARFEEWTPRGPIPGSEPRERRANKESWKNLMRRDPCAYCGRRGGTVDHIVAKLRKTIKPQPLQKWTNYTGACFECNVAKGSTSLLLFLLSRRPA